MLAIRPFTSSSGSPVLPDRLRQIRHLVRQPGPGFFPCIRYRVLDRTISRKRPHASRGPSRSRARAWARYGSAHVRINTILRFYHVMPIWADHFENLPTCPNIVEVMILTNLPRRTPQDHSVRIDIGSSYVSGRR